jgi:hypothetical protein
MAKVVETNGRKTRHFRRLLETVRDLVRVESSPFFVSEECPSISVVTRPQSEPFLKLSSAVGPQRLHNNCVERENPAATRCLGLGKDHVPISNDDPAAADRDPLVGEVHVLPT